MEWNTLPLEIKLEVLKWVKEPSELVLLGLVCKEWNDLVNEECIWENICKTEICYHETKPTHQSWKMFYKQLFEEPQWLQYEDTIISDSGRAIHFNSDDNDHNYSFVYSNQTIYPNHKTYSWKIVLQRGSASIVLVDADNPAIQEGYTAPDVVYPITVFGTRNTPEEIKPIELVEDLYFAKSDTLVLQLDMGDGTLAVRVLTDEIVSPVHPCVSMVEKGRLITKIPNNKKYYLGALMDGAGTQLEFIVETKKSRRRRKKYFNAMGMGCNVM